MELGYLAPEPFSVPSYNVEEATPHTVATVAEVSCSPPSLSSVVPVPPVAIPSAGAHGGWRGLTYLIKIPKQYVILLRIKRRTRW